MSNNWESIETYPKNTKARLVYCAENKCIFCVSYDLVACEWIYFGGGYGTLTHKPTHWMNLPDKPETT